MSTLQAPTSAVVGTAPAGQPTPDVERVLRTIRTVESGGNYTNTNKTSTASGAYQYLDSTWNHYAGYARAKDAPPAVQDQRARADVTNILATHGNDVTAVPQIWYYPAGFGHPNVVPPGNTLSIGQYVQRWMTAYNGAPAGSGSTTSSPPPTQTAGVADVANMLPGGTFGAAAFVIVGIALLVLGIYVTVK